LPELLPEPRQQLQLRLREGLAQLAIEASAAQQQAWLEYIALLAKWNKAYNLTAVDDPLAMVSRHLLDSLSIAPWLQGDTFVDVGTGAGLPGVPLAILFPERNFTLLDSAGKRTRFLIQVQSSLQLSNIHIVQSRAEQHQPAQPFDAILSRAFAALGDMVTHCQHLCRAGGRYYAMKGQPPLDEIAALPATVLVEQQIRLTVPFESAARHLVILAQR
jgi:16S rRNA (guanine527-N7)-methyltransferase